MTKDILQQKLNELPKTPGIYFYKNKNGEIIYIGKAAVLKNRISQYFQKSRSRDAKTTALVAEISDLEYMQVDSELEALFLEAEMVRRYMPKYNILLRDDKSLVYIRINYDDPYPTVGTTRHPLDDGARYFGPYLSSLSVKQALKLLRRVFPYATKQLVGQKRASLHFHLGLDPGLEEGKTSLADYRTNLRRLISVIEGNKNVIVNELEKTMLKYAKAQEFEKAAWAKRQLFSLKQLNRMVIFSDKEFLDISKDQALAEMVNLLSLKKFPRRIEGYDISHMSGTDVVASMVTFTNGVSNRGEYRKFKIKKQQNNDFASMHETIMRRFSQKNVTAWGLPDLVLIDGGKGQLDAAIKARDELSYKSIPFIGLAKREEQVVLRKQFSNVSLDSNVLKKLNSFTTESEDFILINLPTNTNLVKLLQRIRDESHRFAVSYHSSLKTKRVSSSKLDDIPGVGPATRKKLLKAFGSVSGLKLASEIEIAKIVGPKLAETIHLATK